ncbi:MAG: cupin domain-containing protein [Candidatus Eisenbacteria bacterium]|uniref:Cupin domain-containing protein n=1 Tax=Eiseniibacteriota bacterium TaxID=2212470 RepID=A0A948S0A0_UNCEI|nr:cupin domain-containing protein [Candidatus Eisenbacteria bacterium]
MNRETNEKEKEMARVGNRIRPGRFTLGSWSTLKAEDAQNELSQRVIATQRLVVTRCHYRPHAHFPQHSHLQEQITIVERGRLEFVIDDRTIPVNQGEMISVCPRVPHETHVPAGEEVVALNIFLNLSAPCHAPFPGQS